MFVCLFRFTLICVSIVSLDQFIAVLLAIVVLGSVSSVTSQDIGWKERLSKDLFCVVWDLTLTQSINHFYYQGS